MGTLTTNTRHIIPIDKNTHKDKKTTKVDRYRWNISQRDKQGSTNCVAHPKMLMKMQGSDT